MKKIYTLLIASGLTLSAFSQTPAGKSFHINYQEYDTDGLLRYVNCGNNDILNPGDSLSMEAWVKVSQQSVNDNLKIFGKFNLDNTGYLFGKEASELYCEMWTPSQKEIKAGFMPPVAHWAHMVCTFAKGGKIKAYVNGELVGEQSAGNSGITTSTNDFIIGIAPWDLASFQYFGDLDNIRIWNKELSAEEVRYNMHNNLNGDETNLVASYEFNDDLNDQTAHENHGVGNNLSESNYQDSYAVIANETMTQMIDIHAVWLGLSSGTPLISQITDNGLTMSANIYGDEHALFGHNNASGTSYTNIPENSPANFHRQEREWYIQSENVSLATLNFSLSNGEGNIDDSKEAHYYTLLFRENMESDFIAIKAGNVKIGDVISFEGALLNTGYYTIAVGDNPIDELMNIEETSNFKSITYPNPSTGIIFIEHTKPASIRILNTLGEVVYTHGEAAKQQLNLNSLSKGVYFIEVYKNNIVYKTEKLLLQ